MAELEKGCRVRILSGKGKDQEGTVFWTGANNYGPGVRLGVRTEDGDTFWCNEDQVERVEGEQGQLRPPPASGPAPAKGDRVSWSRDGGGAGVVFWVGESKNGAVRVGINPDDGGDAVWMFADRVSVEEAPEPDEEP